MADQGSGISGDPVRFMESDFHAALPSGLIEEAQEDPFLLHHYTSGPGLFGILSSGEIHCTNVLYMNDASELDYGRKLAGSVIENAREDVSQPIRPHLQAIARALEMPDFQYFVSCFCEKTDLLSQWRAYGAQSAGYCIGFAADDVKSVLPEYAELVRVIYQPDEQQRALRRAFRHYLGTAERCCALYPDHRRLADALSRWASATANSLGQLIARMKSPAFEEEHEWRVIIIRFSFDNSRVQFRLASNGIVIPFLPFRFKKDGIKAVREVRHGPTVNPSLAVRSVGALLDHLGYRDVHVAGSAIPLRF